MWLFLRLLFCVSSFNVLKDNWIFIVRRQPIFMLSLSFESKLVVVLYNENSYRLNFSDRWSKGACVPKYD